ncbi:MAG: cation:proton antiporter [Acidimicrobiales bacterium]|nr:cation:proton antiporter [Acidimicrobiales bacterium]
MVVLAASGGTTALVLLELGVVFCVLALLARGARRIGLSPVPLYLLAGLLIGEGSPWELDATDEFIAVAADIGVILLLLLLGLEYTARELTESLRASSAAGAVDFVLNFTPGFVFAYALGWGFTAAFLLGGITYISSSGIIAKILSDLGRLGNRETPAVITLLVIEDLVMAVYLPIAAALVAGLAGPSVLVTISVSLSVVLVALVVAVRYGDSVSRFVFSGSDEVLLFSILGLAFFIAGLAERMMVSSAIGAFLVGVAISGDAARNATAILAPLRDLFAAAFFIFFTYRVDPSAIAGALVPALLLAMVTTGSKFVTGWWSAARAGVGAAGRRRAGIVLIARGEFSIVIAGLAVDSIAPVELSGLATAYVLVLAVSGPLLARLTR